MNTEKVKNICSNAVLVLAILVIGSLLVTGITTGRPNVFGFRVYYIMSESMEPTIMTGQIVVGQTIDADDVKIGDIIAYDRGDMVVIHRVIGIKNTDEVREFYFQGDNNDFVDNPVTDSQIMYKIVVY